MNNLYRRHCLVIVITGGCVSEYCSHCLVIVITICWYILNVKGERNGRD
jgi:hypothetical protein